MSKKGSACRAQDPLARLHQRAARLEHAQRAEAHGRRCPDGLRQLAHQIKQVIRRHAQQERDLVRLVVAEGTRTRR